MRSPIPAILTVAAVSSGIWAGPGMVPKDPPGEPPASQPADLAAVVEVPEGPWTLEPPLRVRTRLRDGRALSGDSAEWDLDGLTIGIVKTPWADFTDPDRFRLLRAGVRGSGLEGLAGWMLIAINLQVHPVDPRYVAQALTRVEQLAPAGEHDAIVARITGEVERRRKVIADAAAAAEAQRLHEGPAHRRVAGTAEWPVPDPRAQEKVATQLRARYADLLEPFQVTGAEGVANLVFGDQPLRELALIAARLDVIHGELATFFSATSDTNIFPGRAVVILLPEETQLRLLAADLFRQDVPVGEHGLLQYDDQSPVILFHPNADPQAELEAMTRLQVLAFLHAHRSRRPLPPWLEIGMADVLAARLMPKSTVDAQRRPRALADLRGGRHPRWLLELAADDPSIWPDGTARDVAFVLVTRLLEANPSSLAGLVDDLKRGEDLDTAFRRRFGVTARGFMDDSAAWFRLND